MVHSRLCFIFLDCTSIRKFHEQFIALRIRMKVRAHIPSETMMIFWTVCNLWRHEFSCDGVKWPIHTVWNAEEYSQACPNQGESIYIHIFCTPRSRNVSRGQWSELSSDFRRDFWYPIGLRTTTGQRCAKTFPIQAHLLNKDPQELTRIRWRSYLCFFLRHPTVGFIKKVSRRSLCHEVSKRSSEKISLGKEKRAFQEKKGHI